MLIRSRPGWRRSAPWAALAAAVLLVAGCLPVAPGDGQGPDGTPGGGGSGVFGHRSAPGGVPLLTEVYYYSAHPQQADEYIRIHNPTWSDLELDGWVVRAAGWEAAFPAGVRLPAFGSLYLARSAAAFTRLMGRAPDLEYAGDTDPAVPDMVRQGEAADLPNRGGEVFLITPNGDVADMVRYGDSAYSGPGWRGWSAWKVWKGEVLDRARDEASVGARAGDVYAPDTDRAEDWKQGDAWTDLRALRPGQSFLPYVTFDVAGSLIAYASPDSSFAVVDRLFARAGRSIDIKLSFH